MGYAYLSHNDNSEAHFLRIVATKEDALEKSYNGKVAETDHPYSLATPSDGKEPREKPNGWFYDHIQFYNVKSAEEAYAVSKKLGELFEQIQ